MLQHLYQAWVAVDQEVDLLAAIMYSYILDPRALAAKHV